MAWFQPFVHAPNCGRIPLLPHIIDKLCILVMPNIDIARYTVRRFTIVYGM